MSTGDEACFAAQYLLFGFTPDSWFPRSSLVRTQPDASWRNVPNIPHDERRIRDGFASVKEERPPAKVGDGICTSSARTARSAAETRTRLAARIMDTTRQTMARAVRILRTQMSLRNVGNFRSFLWRAWHLVDLRHGHGVHSTG